MPTDADARHVLRNNDLGGYTVPTHGLYPYQWNWDSALVAKGWATFDPPRAWQEVESLLAAQWPNGMVPHIVFRQPDPSYFPGPEVWRAGQGALPTSGISQPPVLASAVRRLVEADPARDLRRLETVYRQLDAWHRWWHDVRDPQNAGLITITHPWESGRDNLPDWDAPLAAVDTSGVGSYQRRDTSHVAAAMRPTQADYDRYIALVQFGRERGWDAKRIVVDSPFLVVDPGVLAILIRAERDLLTIASLVGGDCAAINRRIERLIGGFERLWNPEAKGFCSLDLRTGEHCATANAASFLAAYAGVTAHHRTVMAQFAEWAERVQFMLPSFDPRSPEFDPVRYWRGPVWAFFNYLVAIGLAEVGEREWAERLRADTKRLIGGSWFAEYYDPKSGIACGGQEFSWTAAIWLAWGLGEVADR